MAVAGLTGLAVIVIAAASGPRRPSAPPPSPPGAGSLPGAQRYALHCASCHGTAGEGTDDGIPLRGIGAAAVDFVLATGRMPLADPANPMVRRPAIWSRREIDDLVAFVVSLGPGGPPVPTVRPEDGDLARGEQIYAGNCAPCHGGAAQGAAVGEGADAPDLYQATPLEIAEAVRVGPDPMPRFDPGIINQQDLNSLVRYVLFLRHPPDPGGLSLGHIGPVAEGFIAWAVGFAALAVIIRLIGTTT